MVGIQAKGSTYQTRTSRGHGSSCVRSSRCTPRTPRLCCWLGTAHQPTGTSSDYVHELPRLNLPRGWAEMYMNGIHSLLPRGLPPGSRTSITNAKLKPTMVPNAAARMPFLKGSGSSGVPGTVAASTTVAFMS